MVLVILVSQNVVFRHFIKGGHPYPRDNAKHQIEVMKGWVGLKMAHVTLCCNEMSTNFRWVSIYYQTWLYLSGSVGQKYNVTFCVVIWVWTASLASVEKSWKKRQIQSISFFASISESSCATSRTIFETISALGVCHVTIIRGVIYKKSMFHISLWDLFW